MFRFPVFVTILNLRYFEHMFPIYNISLWCEQCLCAFGNDDDKNGWKQTMEKEDDEMKVKIGNKEEVVEVVKVPSSSDSFSCFLFLFPISLHF